MNHRRLGIGGAILVALFLVSGTIHLVAPAVFEPIVPHVLPAPRLLVLLSGIAELVCAVGLLVPRTRRLAGWASCALLVAVLPANVQMALDAIEDRSAGDVGTAYAVATVIRLPLQVPLIWWAWRVTRRNPALTA